MKKLDDAKNTNKSLTWSENDQIYWFNFSLTEEIGRVRARFTYPHKIQDAEGIEKESETLEIVRTQPSDVDVTSPHAWLERQSSHKVIHGRIQWWMFLFMFTVLIFLFYSGGWQHQLCYHFKIKGRRHLFSHSSWKFLPECRVSTCTLISLLPREVFPSFISEKHVSKSLN